MLHHQRLAPIITKGCKVRLFINLLFFYGSGALSLCTAFTFSAVYVTLLQFVAASKVNEIILKVFPTRDLYCNRRYMISCIKILSLKSLCWFRTIKADKRFIDNLIRLAEIQCQNITNCSSLKGFITDYNREITVGLI